MTDLCATPEDVRYAYRLILGREPDPDGLRFHIDLVRKRKLPVSELGELFLSSEEFHDRKAVSAASDEISVRGVSLFPRRNDRLIGKEMRDSGDYEPWVISHFLAELTRGFGVLDVGANIGFFSMLASRAVGSEGIVIAVEPLARNLRSLYAATAANDATNVRVLALAASDKPGIARIACENDSSNGVLVPGIRGGEMVQAGPLDEWLTDMPRLDVVKIDVEGHEPRALRGMRNTLEKFKPILFAEFGPHGVKNHSGVEPKEFADWFAGYGYIDVLRRDGTTITAPSGRALLDLWEKENQCAGMDGHLHLDIRVRPER
jgi:FkbM family methyltransferase